MNTENNKIIAEFMGYENIKSNKEHPMYKIPKFAYTENNFGSIETIDTFSPYFDDMVFHSDWNWLMEVVEKIERYPNARRIETGGEKMKPGHNPRR